MGRANQITERTKHVTHRLPHRHANKDTNTICQALDQFYVLRSEGELKVTPQLEQCMRQLIVLGDVLSEGKPSQDTIKNLKDSINTLKLFVRAVDEKPIKKQRAMEAI